VEGGIIMEGELGLILWTTDIAALAGFLQSVSGLELVEQHPGYALLAAGGSSIMLHSDESYRGHPWYEALAREGAARGIGVELRFNVPDVIARYDTALNLGGRPVQPPYDDNDIRECQIMGPDGFLVTLWQPL
jgi:catechol 2,3-dioxygenase-like lactoylglutathione lyase family enzyme